MRLLEAGISLSTSPGWLCGCSCRKARGSRCADGAVSASCVGGGDLVSVTTGVGSAMRDRLKTLVFTRFGVASGRSLGLGDC